MTELSPQAFLRAQSLEELGEIARELGLTGALRAPMVRVLGPAPKAGRLVREVGKLVTALGTDDVAALLVDAPALLEARPMQGVRKKLFEHARTYLYEAALTEDVAEPTVDPVAGHSEPDRGLAALEAAGVVRRGAVDTPEPGGAPSARSNAGQAARRSAADARTPKGLAQGASRTMGRSVVQDSLREAPPSTPPAGSGRPRTRAELHAWADAKDVRGVLPLRLFSTLSEIEPKLFAGMVDPRVENAPIEDVLTDPALERGSTRQRQRLEALRAAAWRFLDRKAAETAQALEEERKKDWAGRPKPEDEARRALIARLLEARARVRAHVAPRPGVAVRDNRVEVEAGEAPALIYAEAPESRLAFEIKVTVRLEEDGATSLRSTHSGSELDPYVISALDAALELAFDPEDASLAPLLDAVRRPAWQRGLDALVHAAAPPEAEAPLEGALGWWVGIEPALDIRPVQVRRRRGGAPGRPKPVALERVLEVQESLPTRDKDVCELLDLAEVATRRSSQDSLRLKARALARLSGHPRIFFGDDAAPGRLERARAGLSVDLVGDALLVEPQLAGHRLPIQGLDAHRLGRGAGAVVFVRPTETALVFDVVSGAFDRALDVLGRYPRALPVEAKDELVAALPALERIGPVVFAASVPRTKVPAQPTLVLRLEASEQGVLGQVRVRLLDGAPLVVPGEGADEVVAAKKDRSLVFTPRNLASERAWAQAQVEGIFGGSSDVTSSLSFALSTPDEVFALLDDVRGRDGVVVEWAPGGWRVARAYTEDLKVEVRTRRDWFGLAGGVEVDGRRVDIALMLDAAREGRRYVEVAPGDYVQFEAEIVARLQALEASTRSKDGEVQVGPAALDAVEALGEAASGFEVDAGWREALVRMEAAKALEPVPPEGLQAELRPYQRAGFEWLARLSTWGLGACLADDMGLGKTLQTLSVLLYRAQEGPALVVAPTSVTFNWAREAARFTPDLEVRRYSGAGREAALDGLGAGVVVITSYGLATRDEAVLAEIEWATLVLDEAQAIKNPQSQRNQALRNLSVGWRLALSGTPVENRLSELWALFRVVQPSLLGSWTHFKARFGTPIERDGHAPSAEALSRLLRPFVLRRTKREVAPELPPRTDVEVDVVLTEGQRALYEDARLATLARLEEASAEEGGAGRFQVLAGLTRLRQLACHPRLDDPDSEVVGAKLVRTLELVRDIVEEGQSALIFSQFTAHLGLVREALEAEGLQYLYLDGQTPEAARGAAVDAFQGGEAPLFLISLKAGGTGLNLTAADNVLLLDPWWNPAVEDQATDRAHRIGRARPVTVYRLVARGTVEEAILALHKDKRALVGQVLDGTGAAAALGVDELVGLIRGDEA